MMTDVGVGSRYELTWEQKEIKALAADIADNYLQPWAELTESENGLFPRELVRFLARRGLAGVDIPVEYGGPGLDVLTSALVMEEIARGWFAATTYATTLTTGPILMAGTDEQKKRYLPAIASGEIVTAFALTEEGAGSDAGALGTTARLEGDEYVIDGRKIFITNANIADVLVVFARTDPTAGRGKGISMILVERGTAGLEIGRLFGMLAHGANRICEVRFEGCRVPRANRIGDDGRGFDYIQVGFAKSRALYAARCVGLAQAALDYASRYAHERKQFGASLDSLQAIRFKLAEMATEIEAARQLTYRSAVVVDSRAPDAPSFAGMAKLFASEMAMRVTTEALQILGGHGYTKDHPVERYFREAKLTTIGDGSSEVLKLIISRTVRDRAQGLAPYRRDVPDITS
jgi:alkylation response protein AidB-like acyl-CoA dehydrogenase